MTADISESLGDWSIGLRVWLERAGKAVLGPGRFELLQGIEAEHSISAAARKLGISYRHAWLMVQTMNEAAGQPLVAAATGGTHGGGAELTPFGLHVLGLFRDVQQQVQHSAESLWPRVRYGDPKPSVHIAAAVSLDVVMGQLLTDYAQRKPAVRVRAIYGASDELAEHLRAGALVDLFLTADRSQLKQLRQSGVVEPDPPIELAENSLVAIGTADQHLEVRDTADLLRPEITRIALAAPSTPLGRYTRLYLRRQGFYAQVLERALLVDNSRGVVNAVRAGQAEVGLTYGSDAHAFPECRLLFRIVHSPMKIRFTAVLVRHALHPVEARDFLGFLQSPEAADRFRNCGFLPVGGKTA